MKITSRDGHLRLRKKLKDVGKRDKRAARKAKMAELLQTGEEGNAGSGRAVASQRDIVKHADVQTIQKKFDLHLEMGMKVFCGINYSG